MSTPSPNMPIRRQKSDFTLAFIESSEQVAKLAHQSQVGQKIQKLRTIAKSHHQKISPAPPSQFQRSNAKKKILIPKEFSPKQMSPLTPGALKRRYSQQSPKDLAMIKRVESIVAAREAKPRPSKHKEYSAPIDRDSTMKTVKEYSHSEKSESVISDFIEELNVSDDAYQENTPAEEVAVDESRPKDHESGDAEGKNGSMPL